MASIEVGRICVKVSGRESGKKCIIVDIVDKTFALVTGPKQITGIKRRRTNIKHLEPTMEKLDIKKGAGDEDIAKVIQKSKKLEFMKSPVKPVEEVP